MGSTISSAALAFPLKVASIGSGSEINASSVSATALTFAFLEDEAP
jgi:hypothetical protein